MDKRGMRQQNSRPWRVRLGIALAVLSITGSGVLWWLAAGGGPTALVETAPPVASSAPAETTVPTLPPTPTPTSTLEDIWNSKAKELLAEMTLREKICQLFIVFPESITGVGRVVAAGETTQQALEQYPVGGFLYDRSNLESQSQVKTMLTQVQSYAKIPLILTCDEEGGRVNRVMGTVGTTWVGPMLDYQDKGPDTAFENAKTIGEDLRALGFNMDLAPVADVWSNPKNKVIGDRAYSDNFQEAALLIPAAVEGFRAGGVASCLKHFPGHGDTSSDSHYGSVALKKTIDTLREEEFLPFRAGIEAGVDAVMIGHLILPTVDPQPAPFSYTLVTTLLREELGFDGVVITDGLQMKAMTDHYTSGEIAVKAVTAGVDLLLCPKNLDEAVNALIHAVESGTISIERIDESVQRILKLKLRHQIIS